MTQAQSQVQAFDLIIEGVGYLNRVRLVTPKKGPAYLACTVNALKGTSEDVQYVSIDTIVVGKIAKKAVEQLKADVDAKRKVFIGFRAGDPTPDFYEYPDRNNNGEMKTGSGLKARLLQVTFAKVNGNNVDIPLVPRNAKPESDAPQGGHDDGDGVGSACDDESAARTPALA